MDEISKYMSWTTNRIYRDIDKRLKALEGPIDQLTGDVVAPAAKYVAEQTARLAEALGRTGEDRDMTFLLDVVRRVRKGFEEEAANSTAASNRARAIVRELETARRSVAVTLGDDNAGEHTLRALLHRLDIHVADLRLARKERNALHVEAVELRKMNAVHVEEIGEVTKKFDARIQELADLRAQDNDEQRLIRATIDETKKRDVQTKEDAELLDVLAGDIEALNYSFAAGFAGKLRAIARRLRGEPDKVKGCDKQAREDADWLNKLKYQFTASINGETRNRLTDIARRIRGNTK